MTVLFGGSFDPVHNGHINAVKSVRDALSPDKVIIMPAYVSPFKTSQRQGASDIHRLNMCRIAFDGIGTVSDYELTKKDVSYTVDTLEHLIRTSPDEYVLAVGSDSLRTLPQWHRARDIFAMCSIAAVSRKSGEALAPYARAVEDMGGQVMMVQTRPFEVSSTELRGLLSQHGDVSGLMPDGVIRYITENGLYTA